jgi:hypothetical protein
MFVYLTAGKPKCYSLLKKLFLKHKKSAFLKRFLKKIKQKKLFLKYLGF